MSLFLTGLLSAVVMQYYSADDPFSVPNDPQMQITLLFMFLPFISNLPSFMNTSMSQVIIVNKSSGYLKSKVCSSGIVTMSFILQLAQIRFDLMSLVCIFLSYVL